MLSECPVISNCSRADSIKDGVLFDITDVSKPYHLNILRFFILPDCDLQDNHCSEMTLHYTIFPVTQKIVFFSLLIIPAIEYFSFYAA